MQEAVLGSYLCFQEFGIPYRHLGERCEMS